MIAALATAAAVLEVEGGIFPCHHSACDTPDLLDPASTALARRVVATLLTLP